MFKTLTKINQIKFKIQTIVIILMTIVWFFLLFFHVYPTHLNPGKCFFYYNLGIFCPGCGGTRAFEYMLYGCEKFKHDLTSWGLKESRYSTYMFKNSGVRKIPAWAKRK